MKVTFLLLRICLIHYSILNSVHVGSALSSLRLFWMDPGSSRAGLRFKLVSNRGTQLVLLKRFGSRLLATYSLYHYRKLYTAIH